VFPLPKEVEVDEVVGLGDGPGFVVGSTGADPYALFTNDPMNPGA